MYMITGYGDSHSSSTSPIREPWGCMIQEASFNWKWFKSAKIITIKNTQILNKNNVLSK